MNSEGKFNDCCVVRELCFGGKTGIYLIASQSYHGNCKNKTLVQIETPTFHSGSTHPSSSPSTNFHWIILAQKQPSVCSALHRIPAMLTDARICTVRVPVLVKHFNQFPFFPLQRRPFFLQTLLPLSKKPLRLLHLLEVYHFAQ